MSRIWTPDRQIIARSRHVWTPPGRQRGFVCLPGGGLGAGKPSGGGGASITLVASASAAATSVALPSGWAPGDIAVVLQTWTTGNGAPTTPSGWTSISGATNCFCAYRVLQAGDTSTFTVSWAGRTTVLVYRGQNASPIGALASYTLSSTTQSYPALTCQVATGTSTVIFVGTTNNGETLAAPSGYTAIYSASAHVVFHAQNVASTPALSTSGASAYRVSRVFELKAA